MTLPVQVPFNSFSYNGPGVYPCDFPISHAEDLHVQHVKDTGEIVLLTQGQDYTVDYIPFDFPRINLIYDAVDDQGQYSGEIEARRKVPINQPTDWVNQGPFDQELLEHDLDRIVMMLQDTLFATVADANSKWRGPWQPHTAYNLKDMVTGPENSPEALNIYMATTPHQSSDDFNEDFNNGLWMLVMDLAYLYELVIRAENAARESEDARDEACVCRDEAVQARDEALVFRDDAERFAIEAGGYVGQAAEHAEKAHKWSSNPVDLPVENGEFSAYHWAVQAAKFGGINELFSTEPDMLHFSYDPNQPKTRILNVNKDTPRGIPQLDFRGKIKKDQLPWEGSNFLGPIRGDNYCPKPLDQAGDCEEPDYRNPSDRWPNIRFEDGDYFIISTEGDMKCMTATGQVELAHVKVGDAIIYIDKSAVFPPGWYHVVRGDLDDIIAAQVAFDDSSTVIKGSTVQLWNEHADTEIFRKLDKFGDKMLGVLENFYTDPEVVWDNETQDARDSKWRWKLQEKNFKLERIEDDETTWKAVESWNGDQVTYVDYPIVSNPNPPDDPGELVPKEYVDDNFIPKNPEDGKLVFDAELQVKEKLCVLDDPNTPEQPRICINDANQVGSGFVIEFNVNSGQVTMAVDGRTMLTLEPQNAQVQIHDTLKLPANIGDTDP